MNTTIKHDAITETWHDVERIVSSVVRSVNHQHGSSIIEPVELTGEAQVAFLHAYNTHDIAKGEFEPYLRMIIRVKLLDYIRKRVRRNRICPRTMMPVDILEDCISETEPELTSDAVQVLRLTLTLSQCSNPGKHPNRETIRTILRQLGWARNRIQVAFNCIQEVINKDE